MKERPKLSSAKIKDCLFNHYELPAAAVIFMPQGGDINTAVYHVITGDGTSYFLKLRQGPWDELSLLVLKSLSDSGIREIIAPITTISHQLWTRIDDYYVILYPFVKGHNAFELALTEGQWVAFGAALRTIHTTVVPANLRNRMKHETYTALWREKAWALLERVQKETYREPIAAEYAAFLIEKVEEVRHMVQMAEQLSGVLQTQNPAFVLCHSDIHAGNLLMDANRRLYIVDWDIPIIAPKERDLMFIGGGVGSAWYSSKEEALFYQGYGSTEINPVALAYYRFERIVQDIAEWGERVLLTEQGGEDRAGWLKGLKRWFQPNEVVAMAYQAEKNLPMKIRSPKN